MKQKLILLSVLAVFSLNTFAQLSIDSCYVLAKALYPLSSQRGLIDQSEKYSLSNANKAYVPQFSISAKATYQSDVVSMPFTIPGINIPEFYKDQYQAVAQVDQTIWDGGATESNKKNIKASTNVERSKLEVDLYSLYDRINNIYLGVFLLNSQIEQAKTYDSTLEANYNKISGYLAGGVANSADLDLVKVEQLSNKQKIIELQSTQKAYFLMLSSLIGKQITSITQLELPKIDAVEYVLKDYKINRPEISLFNAQLQQINSQKFALNARDMPKFSAFVQGGYGRPGLNMLNPDFAPFYIGGIRLNWSLSGFYTRGKDLKKLELNKQSLKASENTFLFNTSLQITQQKQEIEKIIQIMSDDDEIIRLRNNVVKASEAKMSYGIMSVNDFLMELNKEQLAIQNKALHEMQLIMSVYKLKNIVNQ